MFDELKMYWRFARGLRKFLREPMTLEQSSEIIRHRLKNRAANLLLLTKRAIYENKKSPYQNLLKLAGCEYGDFERMVLSDGVESALKTLAGTGVYISIDEFKGRIGARRGGKVFNFKDEDFNNPLVSGHLETRSGASHSAGTRTIYDFDYLEANRVVYDIHMLDTYGILGIPFALWDPILPGGGPMFILAFIKAGKTPARWFSPIEARSFKPSLKNRMGTSFIVYAGRLSGAKIPRPEFVCPDDAWGISRWMEQAIKEQGGCCLHTYPSLAVRVCQTAKERGIDLAGSVFIVGAEPVTEAKRKEIASIGATICPSYGFTEGGFVGIGCANPVASDDIHLFKDSLALIQQQREVSHAATSVEAFLFTTLLPSAPKILLNVESGDWGVAETRKCGCKLETLGLTDHLYNIRGFDKLTGEGMTFIGTDLVRIIEEVLPAKFGGTSTDYQMVEEEDEQGHTRMIIVASPRLGVIDESELIRTVLTELSKGRDTQRMMAEVWAQAKTLRVKRMQPFTTARGKLMPLHIHQH